MNKNEETAPIACDNPEVDHPGFPCNHADPDAPITIENDPNPPKIAPLFSDRVLALADHVFGRMMDEIQAGEFQVEFNALPKTEQLALYRSLADAFSDTIED